MEQRDVYKRQLTGFAARKRAVLVLLVCYQNRRSGFSRFAG